MGTTAVIPQMVRGAVTTSLLVAIAIVEIVVTGLTRCARSLARPFAALRALAPFAPAGASVASGPSPTTEARLRRPRLPSWHVASHKLKKALRRRRRLRLLLMVIAFPLAPVILAAKFVRAVRVPGGAAVGGAEHVGWTVIEPRQTSVGPRLREIWEYRRLVMFFGRKLVEKMTIRSKLGLLWVPLRPLLTVSSRALVFGGVLGAPSAGLPYFLFFLTGMAVWALFDRTLFWAARSIELNAKVAQKLYFPRLLLPAAALVPSLLDFLVYAVLLAITIAGYAVLGDGAYVQLEPALVFAPLALLLILAMALGLGLFLAVLGAYTRDVRFGLSYVLGFWFFLTPIIYPLEAIPERFQLLAGLNPMTAPIELFRLGLYGSGEVQASALAISVSIAVGSLATGLLYFSRWEATAVDNL